MSVCVWEYQGTQREKERERCVCFCVCVWVWERIHVVKIKQNQPVEFVAVGMVEAERPAGWKG